MIERGYPQTLIENLLSDIKFTERESAPTTLTETQQQRGKRNYILPFATQYQPSVFTLKESFNKSMELIQKQPLLRQIFREPLIISYKKGKSLKDMLVRAKI